MADAISKLNADGPEGGQAAVMPYLFVEAMRRFEEVDAREGRDNTTGLPLVASGSGSNGHGGNEAGPSGPAEAELHSTDDELESQAFGAEQLLVGVERTDTEHGCMRRLDLTGRSHRVPDFIVLSLAEAARDINVREQMRRQLNAVRRLLTFRLRLGRG